MDSPSALSFTFVTLENILLFRSPEDGTSRSFVLILRVGPEDRIQVRLSLDAAATLLADFVNALHRLGYVLEQEDVAEDLLAEDDEDTEEESPTVMTMLDSKPTVTEVGHEAIDCAPIYVSCGPMLPADEQGVFVRLKPLRGEPDFYYSYAFSPRGISSFVPHWLECFRRLGFSLFDAADREEHEDVGDEF